MKLWTQPIVQVAAQSGFEVRLMDVSQAAIDNGIVGITKDLGRLSGLLLGDV